MVQGVGFRYTAQDVASSLGLTGWVKNLYDGRVEVLAEGKLDDLKDFTNKIAGCMGRYIKDADMEWGGATGEFSDFDIRSG
jgi:acylphosphatase